MRKCLVLTLLCGLFCLGGGVSFAKNSKTLRNTTRPSKKPLATFASLKAHFSQKQYFSFMTAPVISTGEIYLSKKRMAWITLQPSESWIVMDGASTKLFYPALKKQQVLSKQNPMMSAVAKNLSMLTRADLKGLQRFYVVKKQAEIWTMTPKINALKKVISSLRLKLDPKGFARWVEVKAPDGDRMEVSFSKVQLNVPAPKKYFGKS
ncbi:MAG TPA: hypothetical protein DCE42_00870 [Myxococcales bacterium]|nr:hypothetical protein [Deltaproteobacteria bacterium]HAA53272.1 hypothetical protein [Myxococcales bacterium]